jgi:hypothetical protein
MRDFRTIVLVLLVAVGAVVDAEGSSLRRRPADQSTTAAIRVRIYDTGVLPAARRTPPLAVATGILRTAGLDVLWLVCETMLAGVDVNPCLTPLHPEELVVRFAELADPTDASAGVQLGFSVIDTATRAGTFATIDVDRARRFAGDSRDEVDVVIGRAIAHEIGHLLLGTNGHAATGVMRATWSRSARQPELARDWLFTRADAMTMRETVRMRVQQTHLASRSIASSESGR